LVKFYADYYWCAVIVGFFDVVLTFGLFFIPGLFDSKDICEEMIERHEMDMDLESCISLIIKLKVFMIVILCLKCLVEVQYLKTFR